MKLSGISFRDLYKQCVILQDNNTFNAAIDMMKEHSFIPAPNWNAVLCYCYIDSMAGMSFHFLCLADCENGEVDIDCYEKLLSERIVLMSRYNGEYSVKAFSGDTAVFSERIKMVDESYHRDEQVLPTRNIKQIDHLRHNAYPDDIQAYLRKRGLQIEQVWVRLTGIKDGNLTGTLLNEPNADFGIHSGDTVRVQVTARDNEIYVVCLLD